MTEFSVLTQKKAFLFQMINQHEKKPRYIHTTDVNAFAQLCCCAVAVVVDDNAQKCLCQYCCAGISVVIVFNKVAKFFFAYFWC